MDYFKESEALLYSVPQKERAIHVLEARKQRLIRKNAPRIPSATDYSKPYTRATFANDPLNDLCELADVSQRIKDMQEEVAEIKQSVEAVPDEELKTLLQLWYFDRLPKETIAERLERWSTKTIYNLRNRAIAAFALMYYGVLLSREK